MHVERLVLGPVQTNAYIVVGEGSTDAVLIDAVDQAHALLEAARRMGVTIRLIVLTHAHFDHVMATTEIHEATGAPVLMHASDLPLLQALPETVRYFFGPGSTPRVPPVHRHVRDGETLEVGSLKLTVLHTPGHSPGSVSLYDGQGAVWCGDALFAGSIGRTDLPGGNLPQLLDAIRTRLFTLPAETVVYPGHGPTTTIGIERQSNPFVGDDALRM